jgi:hypothetical protein
LGFDVRTGKARKLILEQQAIREGYVCFENLKGNADIEIVDLKSVFL